MLVNLIRYCERQSQNFFEHFRLSFVAARFRNVPSAPYLFQFFYHILNLRGQTAAKEADVRDRLIHRIAGFNNRNFQAIAVRSFEMSDSACDLFV